MHTFFSSFLFIWRDIFIMEMIKFDHIFKDSIEILAITNPFLIYLNRIYFIYVCKKDAKDIDKRFIEIRY